ncbi:hypothetical protein BBJ29_003796 [Phytophthora kernoviae]|uniref:F-box domain-containing protein n=1 Tax=Phytophthora kernoviae TaxID=325452 RepID=A0A3F2RFB7_9STRA|nr:hypothetical protein BBP00_00009026 [Phytophthora kernoviae]RLN66878.1 hypothetical protein BBJ29_003796 [Phytophthora kernoviae]
MSATAQELENDVAHMEDRLANVKVVVEVEREAWRRSSHTGKRGTKWKGAAPPHSKEKGATPTTSANILTSDDAGGEITIMPMYWDALELAQYLQTKQLTIYAEVVVSEQITGKLLLDTPATKLRKLFAEVVTIASDPSWKTFQRDSSNIPTEDKVKRRKPIRVATGLASVPAPIESQPVPLTCSESITTNRLGGGNDCGDPPQKVPGKHLRKSKTFARRPSRPDASLNDPNSFDFLHVVAPKREIAAHESLSPSQLGSREVHMPGATAYASRGSPRPLEVAITATSFSVSSSVTSVNPFQAAAIPYSPNVKPMSSGLALSVSGFHEVSNQCKVFQQSKYKLDPDLYQAHEESFSSCFGATPHNRACGSALLAGGGSRVLNPGRGNLLRLQEFLTVRALHRLSLTSRAWYELITTPSAFCDALWGIHVLRMWRPSEEDDAFLYDVGVLKKPERPRRMLQILTRQVARVTVDNMKVLLSPESWQLATVMTTAEGLGVHSLHKVMARTRDRVTCDAGDSLQKAESQHQQLPAELFEQITAIYTRAGEIVAVCARQLIRPVDPMALLTDILQGIKSGELLRVHCRRLRLFSQTNRLPFDQWALLSPCSRAVVGVFWSDTGSEAAVSPPSTLPVWHQKILTKLQHSLQQRLLGKDSIQPVIKLAHDQNAPANTLLSLEKFLTRCHTHTNQRTAESNVLSDGPPAMGANRFR